MWKVIQGLTFILEDWVVRSHFTNCNQLSEGRKGNFSLARDPICVWIWRCWKVKLSHYLLPLLNKSSPLLSPSTLTHAGSIPRSDLKLDCRDCIHISLAQMISLPLSSYTQPYFLDLFCALKSNFRNKCSQVPCGVFLFAWSYFSFHPSSLSLLLLIFVTHRDCFFLSVKTRKHDICWRWIRFYLQYHSTLSSL